MEVVHDVARVGRLHHLRSGTCSADTQVGVTSFDHQVAFGGQRHHARGPHDSGQVEGPGRERPSLETLHHTSLSGGFLGRGTAVRTALVPGDDMSGTVVPGHVIQLVDVCIARVQGSRAVVESSGSRFMF